MADQEVALMLLLVVQVVVQTEVGQPVVVISKVLVQHPVGI